MTGSDHRLGERRTRWLIWAVTAGSAAAGAVGARHRRHRQVLRRQLDELTRKVARREGELATRERALRNLTARQAMILRMERELAGSGDPAHAAGVAARAARTVSGARQVTIWMIDDERASVRLLADTACDDDGTPVSGWAPLDAGAAGAAIAERQPVSTTAADGGVEWAWPLVTASRVIGAMVVTQGPVTLDEAIADAVSTLAIHAGASIEAARLHAENQVLARLDPLTHLPNRRSFDEDLDRERERSRRHGNPVALVMLDLDRFKEINDRYGHPYGDQVLTRVACSIRDTLRKSDSAYRLGGEEFAVIARETDVVGAQLLAERLRAEVEGTLSTDEGDPVGVTASLGVAELGTDQPDLGRLVAAADTALYQAKRTGRNRVEVGVSWRSSADVVSA